MSRVKNKLPTKWCWRPWYRELGDSRETFPVGSFERKIPEKNHHFGSLFGLFNDTMIFFSDGFFRFAHLRFIFLFFLLYVSRTQMTRSLEDLTHQMQGPPKKQVKWALSTLGNHSSWNSMKWGWFGLMYSDHSKKILVISEIPRPFWQDSKKSWEPKGTHPPMPPPPPANKILNVLIRP